MNTSTRPGLPAPATSPFSVQGLLIAVLFGSVALLCPAAEPGRLTTTPPPASHAVTPNAAQARAAKIAALQTRIESLKKQLSELVSQLEQVRQARPDKAAPGQTYEDTLLRWQAKVDGLQKRIDLKKQEIATAEQDLKSLMAKPAGK